MKYAVIYKSYTIKHETFETYAEALEFYKELKTEGCEAEIKEIKKNRR